MSDNKDITYTSINQASMVFCIFIKYAKVKLDWPFILETFVYNYC